LVTKSAAVVADESDFPPQFGRLPPRQQAQVHQYLEAVTDPEDQPAALDKVMQGITQTMLHPHGHDHSRPVIITPGEAATHDEDLKLAKVAGPLDQGIQVDALGTGPGGLQGERGFAVTVESKTGKNQGSWGMHSVLHLVTPRCAARAARCRKGVVAGVVPRTHGSLPPGFFEGGDGFGQQSFAVQPQK